MNIEIGQVRRSAGPAVLADPAGEPCRRGEPQLGEDVLDVRVDRALGEVEPPGDLPVAEAVGDQAGDLPLAPGERPRLAARLAAPRAATSVAAPAAGRGAGRG